MSNEQPYVTLRRVSVLKGIPQTYKNELTETDFDSLQQLENDGLVHIIEATQITRFEGLTKRYDELFSDLACHRNYIRELEKALSSKWHTMFSREKTLKRERVDLAEFSSEYDTLSADYDEIVNAINTEFGFPIRGSKSNFGTGEFKQLTLKVATTGYMAPPYLLTYYHKLPNSKAVRLTEKGAHALIKEDDEGGFGKQKFREQFGVNRADYYR